MELVGTAKEYCEENGYLWIVFSCSNKEEFRFKVSKALRKIPLGLMVRAWTRRPDGEDGMPKKENVLIHWEEL
jgi:hypothetical protein